MRKMGIAAAAALLLITAAPAKAQRIGPGEALPAFTLTDTEGRVHRRTDYAGKPMVLYLIGHN